ncbi:choline/ethanolamine kinase-like, partial [Homarus americanus]|uniref:choline/ethanolamine kinase-like n=1 Tax=Homarus americanus TaxID=6706 RepID=UPI001C46BE52
MISDLTESIVLVHGEDALESVLAESVIFALLSERRLGPRLYGVFPGGRLEQFIPARSLFTSELADPELSSIIATKMANIHALNVPISKEPTWIWNTMEKWLKSGQEFLCKTPSIDGVDSSIIEGLQKINYHNEMEYLKQVVAKVQSPVVFAHNDMQEGNILLKTHTKSNEDRICLIDFEYCSYNYRGFDLANHFCEWMYNYKFPVHPYFTVAKDNFPPKDKQADPGYERPTYEHPPIQTSFTSSDPIWKLMGHHEEESSRHPLVDIQG